MDKNTARSLQTRALEALKREFGDTIQITSAGGQRGELKATLKFDFVTASTEDLEAVERKTYGFAAYAYPALTPDTFGARFDHAGRTYTIRGYSPMKPKFAIKCERDDGKRFGFPANVVIGCLAVRRVVA